MRGEKEKQAHRHARSVPIYTAAIFSLKMILIVLKTNKGGKFLQNCTWTITAECSDYLFLLSTICMAVK